MARKYGKIKSHLVKLQKKTDECTAFSLDAKEKYVRCMSNKLNDPLTAHKIYCSILNPVLNNKKVPAVPPLLVNSNIITTFLKMLIFLMRFYRSMYTL